MAEKKYDEDKLLDELLEKVKAGEDKVKRVEKFAELRSIVKEYDSYLDDSPKDKIRKGIAHLVKGNKYLDYIMKKIRENTERDLDAYRYAARNYIRALECGVDEEAVIKRLIRLGKVLLNNEKTGSAEINLAKKILGYAKELKEKGYEQIRSDEPPL